MVKPVYDLILGCNTMNELGIVLDFRTKQITIDEIMLPLRNISSLASTKIDKAWAVNNSMAHEPVSTKNATQRVVQILDANYEKSDRKQWYKPLDHTSASKTRTSYWSYSRNLKSCLTGH
jgi:predicted oxidoreductase